MKSVWERCSVPYLVAFTVILITVECFNCDFRQYNQVLAPQALPGEPSTMTEPGRQFVKISESFQNVNKLSLKNRFFKTCMQMKKVPVGLRISFNLCQDINDEDLVNRITETRSLVARKCRRPLFWPKQEKIYRHCQ